MSDNPPIFLLSVGVDKYKNPAVNDLQGCVRDAELLQSVFRTQFGVPPENILALIDEQADGEAIVSAFRSHLTENARKWKEKKDDSPSPAFVFHFAGHGSVCRDKTQTPNTFDESTLPYDARTPGKYDIRDWQLRKYIDELSAFTDNVTIILDCCCSGSGTRDSEEEDDDSNTRSAPPDDRDQPEYFVPTVETAANDKSVGTRSASNDTGGTSHGSSEGHVLLAACRSYEKAKEHQTVDENGKKVKNGVFTLFLAQELAQLPTDRTLTYQELLGRVRFHVQREYSTQAPQCEGDVDRELFGGVRPKRDTMFDVTDPADGLFKINAGQVHGLTEGLVVDVFPPGTTEADAAESKTATAENVQATHSFCRMIDGSTPEVMSRVQPRNAGFGGKVRRVAFDLTDDSLKSKLKRAGNDATLEVTDSVTYADFIVRQVAGLLEIHDPSDGRLVAPFDLDNVDGLCEALCGIAKYRNTMELNNTSPSSQLNKTGLTIEMFEFGFGVALEGLDDELYDMMLTAIDKERQKGFGKVDPSIAVVRSDQSPHFVVRQKQKEVTVENEQDELLHGPFAINASTVNQVIQALTTAAKTEYATEKPQGRPRDPARAMPHSDGRPIVVENGIYMVKVTNKSPQVVHWDVLAFGYDYSITALKPLLVKYAGLDDKELLATTHPAHQPGWLKLKYESTVNDSQFVEANESLKVIGTLEKVNYEFLEQKGLQMTRWGAAETKQEEDWTTANLQYVVVREDPTRIQLSSGQKTDVPQFELAVSAPAGVGVHVEVHTRLQSAMQNVNRTEAETRVVPPAISMTENRAPVSVNSTRGIGINASEVELFLPAEESSNVSYDTPVALHIKDPGQGQLLSVSHDGELFFPLGISTEASANESQSGHSEKTVPVTWTPPESGNEATSRSALHSIRLLVYRVLKKTPPELGVHHAEVISADEIDPSLPARHVTVDTGVVRYTTLQNADLSQAKKVALIIHGLAGQTDWMVANAAKEFAARGVKYDAVLTFDYESIVTPIRDNAKAMAESLQANGFSADDNFELDIFADGSGGLVARSMIEQSGGADFVDRCFMTGTPHNGTPIAHATRLAPILGTLAMNSVFPGATAVVGTFIGKRIGDGKGTADLQPTSDFLKTLNASDSTPQTHYFALAGTGPTSGGKRDSWSRFVCQSIDATLSAIPTLFESAHDMLVDIQSATEIRNGKYPGDLMESKCVPGSHFEYFQNPAAWDQLCEWIKS